MDNSVQDAIIEAFTDIGVYAPGESVDAPLANYGLQKANELLDSWNVERNLIFTTQFSQFTLTPNLQPHTIGPTGTFNVPGIRPVEILGANLILNNVSPNANLPIFIRDADWWLQQRVKPLATNFPTDLYYEPDFANAVNSNGSCFFWPVPLVAYPVLLQLRSAVGNNNLTLASNLFMPPGYQRAFVKTLAVELWSGLNPGQPIDPVLVETVRQARSVIRSLNSKSPRIATGRDGLPSQQGARPSFNWQTGLNSNYGGR